MQLSHKFGPITFVLYPLVLFCTHLFEFQRVHVPIHIKL